MPMNNNIDPANDQTEKILADLEKKIESVYKKASDDMKDKIDAYFERFTKLDAEKKKQLEAGEITKKEYQQWRLNQLTTGERYIALRDAIAKRMTDANTVAVAYINDATPSIYSLNRNYSAYTIEKAAGNIGFTLWDESTIRRLIVEDPDLMPYYPKDKAINRGIDLAWGKRQINANITSGILQGQSLPEIAKNLRKSIMKSDRAASIRTARTAVTSAQNGGRMASYKYASDMGIKVRKVWVATKDGRTRDSHRKLDGKTVDWDESFNSILGKIRYPGDTRAKPENLYNCRCRVRTEFPKSLEADPRKMRVRDPKTGKSVVVNEMTYDEWERWAKGR